MKEAPIPGPVGKQVLRSLQAMLSAEPQVVLLHRERVLGMLAAVALAAEVVHAEDEPFLIDLDRMVVATTPEAPVAIPNRQARRKKK
jgi:hypothetical protein